MKHTALWKGEKMDENIVAYIVIIIGAIIGYKPKVLSRILKVQEVSEKQSIIIKLVGLVFVLIGVLMVFYA